MTVSKNMDNKDYTIKLVMLSPPKDLPTPVVYPIVEHGGSLSRGFVFHIPFAPHQ